MISTVYNSSPVFLITLPPDGTMKVTLSKLSDRQAGRTRREERRTLGSTLRWKLDYSALVLDRVTAQATRLSLKAWDGRPVLCPLWMAAAAFSATPMFTGALHCTWEPDFAVWELHRTPAPAGFTPSTLAMTAPVLWGTLEKLPDPSLITPEAGTIPITFVETGPADLAIAPAPSVVVPLGPVLHGSPWPIIDLDVDYSSSKAGGVDIQVSRERLGYGRGQTETLYPQTPRRTTNATVFGELKDFVRLIAVFHASGGSVYPVWFPSGYAPTRLTANTSSGSVQISVEDPNALGGHPHLVLRDFSGAVVPCEVDSIAGKIVNLKASPGAFAREGISLQLLLFGRFSDDDLVINWESALKLSSQFMLTEIPSDYGSPSGETYGATIGGVGAPIMLLDIEDQVGGLWHWTNYEAQVSVDTFVYEARQFSWDEIQEALNMDDGSVNLTCDSWEGNPFMRLLRPHRGQQLKVTLKEWASGSASTSTWLWSGTATSAKGRGRKLTIPVKGEGRMFEVLVPRRLDTPACSWTVFGPGCELNPDSFAVLATVQASVAVLQYTVQVSGSFADHYFAGGWLKRADSIDGCRTFSILDSVQAGSGLHTITVDLPISPAFSEAEMVTLYPGCDCSWGNCSALGNTTHFSGAPRKPSANPAFTAIKQTTASTGKK